MAHYAKIKNGIVTAVIVAEQDFINSLDDAISYVQTSYNTRAGVHYNYNSWEPSGKPAFRKNYAKVGGYYDPVADAFAVFTTRA